MAICLQWVDFVLCVCVSLGVCMFACLLLCACNRERANERTSDRALSCNGKYMRNSNAWHTNNTSTRLCFLMKRPIRVVCKCNAMQYYSRWLCLLSTLIFNNELNNRQLIDTMSSVFLPCILDICLEMRKKNTSNLIYTNNIGREINWHRNKLLHRHLFAIAASDRK